MPRYDSTESIGAFWHVPATNPLAARVAKRVHGLP
jgi:hypothetical protein